MLIIYVAATKHLESGPGGWGAIAYSNDKEVWRDAVCDEDCFTKRMEVAAVIDAIKFAAFRPCLIYIDSEECVKTLNIWVKAWEERGWMRERTEKHKNLKILKQASSLLETSNAGLVFAKKGQSVVNDQCIVWATELAIRARDYAVGLNSSEAA